MWRSYIEKYEQKNHTTKSSYSRKFQWKIKNNMKFTRGTRRPIPSAFFQLKLGHGFIKSYLTRFGLCQDKKYECGKTETPDHLLLSCRIFNIYRKILEKKTSTVTTYC